MYTDFYDYITCLYTLGIDWTLDTCLIGDDYAQISLEEKKFILNNPNNYLWCMEYKGKEQQAYFCQQRYDSHNFF